MECAQQKTKTSSIPADSSHAIMGTFTNGSSTFKHQIGNPHKNVTRVEYEQSTPPFNIKYKTLNIIDAWSIGSNAFPSFPTKDVWTGCSDTPSATQVR